MRIVFACIALGEAATRPDDFIAISYGLNDFIQPARANRRLEFLAIGKSNA
jgi:hypothetical protein